MVGIVPAPPTTMSRIRSAAWHAADAGQLPLVLWERALPHGNDILQAHPPVFIVGAPRCGSTLLMQVLLRHLEVSYLSNRHARFWGAPVVVERFARPEVDPSDPFTSHHGATANPAGPSESAKWWYRFFPRDPVAVERGQLSARRRTSFSRSLAALTEAAGQPLLFKNLYVSLRILEIARIVPESRFIHLKRDVADNAHSLLEARYSANGNYQDWFSLPPPGWEEMCSAAPATQVVWQIWTTNDLIERHLGEHRSHSGRVLALDYEDFCARPRATIAKVGDAFQIPLRTQELATLPTSFPMRTEIRIPAKLNAAVELEAVRLTQR